MSFLHLAASRRHPELPLGQGAPQDTWAQKFEAFDAAHPEAFALFEECAFVRIRAGRLYLSPRDLFSDMRDIEGKCPNNNYSRFYGDKFKAKYPQHAHLFRERKRPEKAMRLVYAK